MKKIILTESQIKTLTDKLINESSYLSTDDEFKIECEVNLNYYNATYKQGEINHIITSNIQLTHNIDMDVRSYGIRDISIYNLKGPSEIELEIYYYGENDENLEDVITVPLNWENVEMQKDEDLGYIGISNNIQIDIENDENGDLVVTGIIVNYNSI
jgi:hypothetical protein